MFWEKPRRGEYDAGQYRRVGKGGTQVWIQASYNPIFDMNGKPFNVVRYATDVTEARKQNEMNAAFKGALDNLTSNGMLADTDLNIIYMNNTVRDRCRVGESRRQAGAAYAAANGPVAPRSRRQSWAPPVSSMVIRTGKNSRSG